MSTIWMRVLRQQKVHNTTPWKAVCFMIRAGRKFRPRAIKSLLIASHSTVNTQTQASRPNNSISEKQNRKTSLTKPHRCCRVLLIRKWRRSVGLEGWWWCTCYSQVRSACWWWFRTVQINSVFDEGAPCERLPPPDFPACKSSFQHQTKIVNKGWFLGFVHKYLKTWGTWKLMNGEGTSSFRMSYGGTDARADRKQNSHPPQFLFSN